LGVRGHEKGTVTGRSRRCGWFDAALVRQAAIISSIDGIALTKLDVLDTLLELKICVNYRLDGAEIDHIPGAAGRQARLEPVYETLPGWNCCTRGINRWADLPAQMIAYVARIEALVGVPVMVLSTGPERDETILRADPFAPAP
jgi:adenylosuccinate synthase